jgi:hypothetical protein
MESFSMISLLKWIPEFVEDIFSNNVFLWAQEVNINIPVNKMNTGTNLGKDCIREFSPIQCMKKRTLYLLKNIICWF